MLMILVSVLLFLGGRRKIEKESSSPIQFRFGPDGPAMLVNNPLHRRQAYPCTIEIFLAVKTLEHSKQLIRIFHVEAHSVVPNKNCRRAFALHLSNFDQGRLARPAVLDRVRE